MALRMRRKGIQVFIIAPLKGHEFHRACSNIGGQFISISPASQNCINIMEIRKADKSVDDLLDGPGAENLCWQPKFSGCTRFQPLNSGHVPRGAAASG